VHFLVGICMTWRCRLPRAVGFLIGTKYVERLKLK